jgi:hypothetical protein
LGAGQRKPVLAHVGGFGFGQPAQQHGQSAIDPIDVEDRDLHSEPIALYEPQQIHAESNAVGPPALSRGASRLVLLPRANRGGDDEKKHAGETAATILLTDREVLP